MDRFVYFSLFKLYEATSYGIFQLHPSTEPLQMWVLCMTKSIPEDFADVVNNTVQFPLNIDLLHSTKGKPVQFFSPFDLAKYRLRGCQSHAIQKSTFYGVDLSFHFLSICFMACHGFSRKEMNLTGCLLFLLITLLEYNIFYNLSSKIPLINVQLPKSLALCL